MVSDNLFSFAANNNGFDKEIVKLYDSEDSSIPSSDDFTWSTIKQRLNDGSVERLKKAAGSETVYILFYKTCIRNDVDK